MAILIGARQSRSVACVRVHTSSTSTANLTFAVGLAAAGFVLTPTSALGDGSALEASALEASALGDGSVLEASALGDGSALEASALGDGSALEASALGRDGSPLEASARAGEDGSVLQGERGGR